ncbi:hypothetical protein BGO17_02240 [Candidatus Saccharibacteria bacterium 49-20]|nr:MAG: hypothetical protein BGO17_02240 [Candidatus Saccharibacteria bacterium 49-20]
MPVNSEDSTFAAGQKGIYSLAVRRDADTAPVADGKFMGLVMDDEGRLKTSNKTASFPVTAGAVNTVGATLTVDVRRASNVVFHVKNTGTAAMAAGQFSFEASLDSTDGTNGTWFSMQAIRSNANTIETGTGTLAIAIGAGLVYSWEASVNAYQFARVRCTTAVTTNAVATWIAQRGSYATEPIPAAQSHAVTLSGSSNAVNNTPVVGINTNLAGVVTAATTNAILVKTGSTALYELTLSNVTATPAFFKVYNKSSAPTVGTDVPMATFPIPANTTVVYEFGPVGKRFTTGFAVSVTGAAAANDATAAVAGIQLSATYN